jgi:hypothetical protein
MNIKVPWIISINECGWFQFPGNVWGMLASGAWETPQKTAEATEWRIIGRSSIAPGIARAYTPDADIYLGTTALQFHTTQQ